MITNRIAANSLLCRLNDRSIELTFHNDTGVLYWYEVEGGATDLESSLLLDTVLSNLVSSRDVVIDNEYEFPVYTLAAIPHREVRS